MLLLQLYTTTHVGVLVAVPNPRKLAISTILGVEGRLPFTLFNLIRLSYHYQNGIL